MLQYFKFNTELQETNSVVSFKTTGDIRVDISKKFLRKDALNNRWTFVKPVMNPHAKTVVPTKTFITGEVYIVQCSESADSRDASGNTIYSATDLISFQEVNKY